MRRDHHDKTHEWHRYCWLLGLIALAIRLSACSQKPKVPQFTGKVYDLIPQAEVETLTGRQMNAPKETVRESKQAGFTTYLCNYSSAGEKDLLSVGWLLTPRRDQKNAAEAYAQYQEEMKRTLGPNVTLTDVSGLGERAVWLDFPDQLSVFVKDWLVIFTMIPENDANKALALALAEKLLARLPK